MKEKHVIALLPAYLDDQLDDLQNKEVKQHLKECPNCDKELKNLKVLLSAFEKEEIASPSEGLRTNFYELLEKEKKESTPVISMPRSATTRKSNWTSHLLKIAASVVLLISGFYMGKYRQKDRSNEEIALLKDERMEIKQTAMLSLMENGSASKRIQGVSYIEDFSQPDEAIVEALIERMHFDENTNVRLTATEALAKFTDSENVKDAFIKVLKTEKDPRIQITAIQILVNINEKKAVEPMRALLKQESTQPFVKDQITSLIPNII